MSKKPKKKDATKNVSAENREKLKIKLAEIKDFIIRTKQSKNKESLLLYLTELEGELDSQYGLVFEEHREGIDYKLETHLPILEEKEKPFGGDEDAPVNFLIEGDNLASLKLLKRTHTGKIDLIYIDPPYNTGRSDFRYGDRFVGEADKFRHSKWLSFMSSRLEDAQELLSENGVIFISIDDHELAPLRLLCDKVFGGKNFISLYPRLRVKGGKTQTNLSPKNCDYLIAFAKNITQAAFNKIVIKDDPAFKYEDEYLATRGKYHTKQALDTASLGYVASLDYPIEHDGITYYPGQTEEKNGYRWTWSRDKYEFALKNDFVVFKNGRIFPKKYLKASIEKNESGYYIEYVDKAKNYSQIHFIDNTYSNTNGKKDLSGLQLNFSHPKPVSLVKELLKMATKPDATILDFFAGSGTTGQAVMSLNAEDGGKRKFILCTNNENNICREITYKRIKRAIKKYNYNALLKYFCVEFVPTSGRYPLEYADELSKHVRQLIELEDAINFTNNSKIAIILKEKELKDFVPSQGMVVYLAHKISLNDEQEQLFEKKEITVRRIPEYYYKGER